MRDPHREESVWWMWPMTHEMSDKLSGRSVRLSILESSSYAFGPCKLSRIWYKSSQPKWKRGKSTWTLLIKHDNCTASRLFEFQYNASKLAAESLKSLRRKRRKVRWRNLNPFPVYYRMSCQIRVLVINQNIALYVRYLAFNSKQEDQQWVSLLTLHIRRCWCWQVKEVERTPGDSFSTSRRSETLTKLGCYYKLSARLKINTPMKRRWSVDVAIIQGCSHSPHLYFSLLVDLQATPIISETGSHAEKDSIVRLHVNTLKIFWGNVTPLSRGILSSFKHFYFEIWMEVPIRSPTRRV